MGIVTSVHHDHFDFDGLPFGDGGPLAFQVTDAAWLFLRVPAATHANHDGRLRPFGMGSSAASNKVLVAPCQASGS